LQRDAVDSGEIGSERPHVSSTGAIVAPLVARQELEIRVLHDPDTLARTSIFMKMMTHRQQRRTSLGVALGFEAHPQREHVVTGRLMSYGISVAGAYREGRRLRWRSRRLRSCHACRRRSSAPRLATMGYASGRGTRQKLRGPAAGRARYLAARGLSFVAPLHFTANVRDHVGARGSEGDAACPIAESHLGARTQ
jgi:hypothetical protein